jgi:hypothetical protein
MGSESLSWSIEEAAGGSTPGMLCGVSDVLCAWKLMSHWRACMLAFPVCGGDHKPTIRIGAQKSRREN